MKTPLSWSFKKRCMANTQHAQVNSLSEEEIVYKARGFCATLSKSGTQSMRSDDLEDFFPLIKQASIAWVDCIVDDVEKDVVQVATKFSFSELLATRLLKNARSGYEDYDTEMGILLPAIYVKGFNVTIHPLLILLKKNLILSIHTRETKRFFHIRRYAETFFKKLPKDLKQDDRLTLVLIRIIDESNSKNFEHLQEIEESGDELSKDLANDRTPRVKLGERIYQMKHALIVYLSGLWATADTLYELRYGDADLIADDASVLDRIVLMINEVHSQIGIAEHLSEVLASGLECLQSIYNNQLQVINNRLSFLMGILTIIGTALLVPNTIATVLSQTNIFQFAPKDTGWYLTLIVASTVIATIFAWFAVKRMGFLPKYPDEE